MTAHYSCPDRPGSTRAEIEAFLKQCSRPQLEAMLRTVQLRLGSPAETPGDVDCAQSIVHQLNNVLTAERAEELIRQLDSR